MAGLGVGPGDFLWYSPVTPLELAGKWSSRTFEARRDAAAAIVKSTATELPDPESFLTTTFGYTLAQPVFSFTEGVKAMANAQTMKEIVSGVRDVPAQLIRRVSVPKVHTWRRVTEGKWVEDLLAIQKSKIKRFAAWYHPDPKRRKGAVPKLTGNEKAAFLSATISQEWATTLVVACQTRALLGAKRGPDLIPTRASVPKLSAAMADVSCYCAVYTQYLIRLLTEGALPELNDSGDLELFLYAVDDSSVIVTSEKKWRRLADAAGFGQRVRLV